jgi:hypothetical protein
MKLWLSADGPNTTSQFDGASNSPEPFFDRFKGEFRVKTLERIGTSKLTELPV